MLNLIQADLFKVSKSTAVKVSFLIMCLSAAAVTGISYLMAQGRIGIQMSGSAAGLSDIMMMTIIGPFIAGVIICGDFENKTMQDAVLCGCGRGTVMVSKAIAYFFMLALMLLPYCVATVIGFGAGSGFSKPFAASVFLNILANKSGMAFTLPVFMKMLAVMLTMITVYAGQLSICILLAFILRKPVLVVGIGFIATLLFQLVAGLGGSIKVLGDVLSYTPFAMGFTVVTMDAGAGVLLKAAAVSLAFIILVLAVTYGAFKRSEIK